MTKLPTCGNDNTAQCTPTQLSEQSELPTIDELRMETCVNTVNLKSQMV